MKIYQPPQKPGKKPGFDISGPLLVDTLWSVYYYLRMVCSEMNRRLFIVTLILELLLFVTLCAAVQGIKDKSTVETQLKDLFKHEDVEKLKPFLAENSRIFLSLEKIKNAKGFFSTEQTLLIFKEFFTDISTLDLNLESSARDPSSPLFMKISLTFKDKTSKIGTVDVSFTFIKEDSYWRIKEIRETGS